MPLGVKKGHRRYVAVDNRTRVGCVAMEGDEDGNEKIPKRRAQRTANKKITDVVGYRPRVVVRFHAC